MGAIIMMKNVFQQYKKNISKFIIVFVLIILVNIIPIERILPDSLSLSIILGLVANYRYIVYIVMISILLIRSFISTYGLLIAKKIVKEQEIKQKEIFSEVFRYYPKVIVFGLILGAILVEVSFIGIKLMITNRISRILSFILFITVLILSIILSPTYSYIIYHNEKIWDSVKSAFQIGKKYFFRLFGVFLILAVIPQLVNMAPYGIVSFILLVIFSCLSKGYLYLYITNIIRMEGEAEEEIL